MADHYYAKAQSWEELCQAHTKYMQDYREQEHWAHQEREDGKRTPKAVLGWAQGRPITPALLDDAFTFRFLRRLDAHGNVQLHHWKLYAEAGLPHAPTNIWIKDQILTIAAAQTPLAEYEVRYDAKQRQLVDVGDVRLFHTPHASRQRWLWSIEDLEEISWHPARKIEPIPVRRRRRGPGMSPLWDPQVLAALRQPEDDPDERRRQWRYPLVHPDADDHD